MTYLPHPDRYKQMDYRRSGKSGLLLPAISLGLWHNFGGIDSFQNGRQIVRHAFDQGITHFDLANNYGPPPGSAEENFGRILHKDFGGNLRDELILSTKAGYRMWEGPYGEWGSKKHLTASLDQSLKRMRVDYVDIFYSHRVDPNTPLEETMGALSMAVKQGKALYVGISSYGTEETLAALEILNSNGTPCLIHQPRYSMYDRWIEEGLTEILEQNGIGCIPFSPLAQGLLTDKYLKGIPANSRAAKPSGFLQSGEVTKEKLNQIKRLNELALQRDQSLAQMALAWILKKQVITSVLVGVSSIAQLDDNLKGLKNITFDNEELATIESILSDAE